MVEPPVKRKKRMRPAEPMQQMVIDLAIDDDEWGGRGPEPLMGEESESEEEESSSDESSSSEESVSHEDDDGNAHHHDQLMSSESVFIVPYGKGCRNAGGSLGQLQGLYTS
jgi:hypothetical protein